MSYTNSRENSNFGTDYKDKGGDKYMSACTCTNDKSSIYILHIFIVAYRGYTIQLLGSGTVSQTMLLERLPVQGSILLKGVHIGFFWQMVFHDFSILPIAY